MMKQRRHLFLQLGSYNLGELVEHLDALSRADNGLVDLIVTYTGDANGTLFKDRLDILDPYLPWGPKRFVANVFFGTVADYTGWEKPYGASMTIGDFRWDLILQQRRLLSALDARYKGKPWHGYIEHEGVLDIIATNPLVAAGYEAFLVQSIRDIRRFRPTAAVAWSPAFWQIEVPQGARAAIDRLMARIKMFTGEPGLDWILLQDMIGREWPKSPQPTDVAAWYAALGDQYRSKQVNVEQFEVHDGNMVPANPTRVQDYEDHYRALGLRIGASWEMRWYMRQAEPATNPLMVLASTGQGGSWPWPAAHNTWASRRAQVRDWLRDGIHRGSYSRRAELAEKIGGEVRRITGLTVQGIRYMRPYDPNPPSGRAVNSDHLTAGAIDIMIHPSHPEETFWLSHLYELLDHLKGRHVVRYYIPLGANDAHWNHVHVSFQIGARL